MIRTTICCDVCGMELPKKVVNTPYGKVEFVKTSKAEVWNVSTVFPHLCKGCALTIDNALLKTKMDLLLEV